MAGYLYEINIKKTDEVFNSLLDDDKKGMQDLVKVRFARVGSIRGDSDNWSFLIGAVYDDQDVIKKKVYIEQNKKGEEDVTELVAGALFAKIKGDDVFVCPVYDPSVTSSDKKIITEDDVELYIRGEKDLDYEKDFSAAGKKLREKEKKAVKRVGEAGFNQKSFSTRLRGSIKNLDGYLTIGKTPDLSKSAGKLASLIERGLPTIMSKFGKKITPKMRDVFFLDKKELKRIQRLKKFKVSKKKYKRFNFPKGVSKSLDLYLCYYVASFFQQLVANTPLDEDYNYSREKVGYDEQGAIIRSSIVEETHYADKEKVRGDWVLTYRGVGFKAFESKKPEGAQSIPYSITFNEKYFYTPGDEGSVLAIAKIIQKNTVYNELEIAAPLNFSYDNINPRWKILEIGGYTRTTKDMDQENRPGSRYAHGTRGGFTYQAPHGFVRLTEAFWNMNIRGNQWGRFIKEIPKQQTDLASMDKELLEKLKKYNPLIGAHFFTDDEFGG